MRHGYFKSSQNNKTQKKKKKNCKKGEIFGLPKGCVAVELDPNGHEEERGRGEERLAQPQ